MRLVTAQGDSLQWGRRDESPGQCYFLHPRNERRPFRAHRYLIDQAQVDDTVQRFVAATTLERATVVRRWKRAARGAEETGPQPLYRAVGERGTLVSNGGDPPDGSILFLVAEPLLSCVVGRILKKVSLVVT